MDDNFVTFGTALDPIEEEEVARKKPITIADQIATDEQGRRRFHGAFTGGFSAGYFNTVGSKEGWTPSTFKSSRAERIQHGKGQNVMDFMDDEDMGAFGIAPQVLRPTDQFTAKESQSSSRKRPKPQQSDGPIPGIPVLQQIIQPVRETVGIRILMKMGWKPGQGVGPRVTKKKKSKDQRKTVGEEDIDKPLVLDENTDVERLKQQKAYGCSLPEGFKSKVTEQEEPSDEEFDVDVLYAPDDVESPLCNPKENTFGLGYSGLERMSGPSTHVDLFGRQLKFRVDNKKVAISGEAFGIGAFEEPDEDVYSKEDMSTYDFELETPEEKKARKAKEAKEKSKKQQQRDKCIEGFHISKNIKAKKKYFPPPHLPHDFQPMHKQRKSRFDKPPEKAEDSTVKRGLGRHALTAQERQVLLGEEQRQPHSQSVPAPPIPLDVDASTESESQKLRPEDDSSIRERVERIKKFVQVLQQAHGEGKFTEPAVSQPVFQPFMKNPEKQERYEKYLTLVQAGFQDCLKDLQPLDMTEWEREREKQEFDKARAIYKPLSGVMSSRFVTAKSHDISHVVPEKEVVAEKDPSEDPKVAAKLNLFGKLTHNVIEWHPDKVLCKRFNIKDPYPDSKFVGIRGVPSARRNAIATDSDTVNSRPAVEPSLAGEPTPVPKKSLFDNLDFSKPPPGCFEAHQPQQETHETSPQQSASSKLAPNPTKPLEFQSSIQVKDQTEDEEKPPPKAPLDLFKQIFAESSGSENENENDDHLKGPTASSKESTSNSVGSILLDKRPPQDSKSMVRTGRQEGPKAKSIFDDLDLNKVNRRKSDTRDNEKEMSTGRIYKEDGHEVEESIYGPMVPVKTLSSSTNNNNGRPPETSVPSHPSFSLATYKKSSCDIHQKNLEEELVWVEKEAGSKRKKHSVKKRKKKGKSKEKKKKHKKSSKKAKHRTQEHSDNSSGTDDESDESNSSVEIHGSLNQKALLSQLKHITGSN